MTMILNVLINVGVGLIIAGYGAYLLIWLANKVEYLARNSRVVFLASVGIAVLATATLLISKPLRLGGEGGGYAGQPPDIDEGTLRR